jgi:hypothetical protein
MSKEQNLEAGLGALTFAEGKSVRGGVYNTAVAVTDSELTGVVGATGMLASINAGSKSTFGLGAQTKVVISSTAQPVSEITVKAGTHAYFEDGVAATKLVLNPGSSAHFEGGFSVTDIVAPAEGDGVREGTEGTIVSCGDVTAGNTMTIGRDNHVNFEGDVKAQELVFNPGSSAHFKGGVHITDISSQTIGGVVLSFGDQASPVLDDIDRVLEMADTSGAGTLDVQPLGDVADLN